jgi:glycosyl transferase family 25
MIYSHNKKIMGFFQFTKDNTFCISLEKNEERWNRMQSRFQQEELEVTRWIASTPDTLIDNFYHYLNPHEKACSQSHVRIWRYMMAENIEYALILEDDACFDKDWRMKLDTFQIDDDPLWDLLLLNAYDSIRPPFQWINIRDQYLTGGYVLSIRGANRLIRWYGDKFAASDWMTSRLQQNNHSYSYFPWLIIQENKDSALKKNQEEVNTNYQKVLQCLKEIEYDISNYRI